LRTDDLMEICQLLARYAVTITQGDIEGLLAVFTDSPWRPEYLFSRAATIYGGTAEIQRNIIARRLLGLGKE
jgi:alkylation response protein AidB-like acyl-CoA dehydrogenase